MNHLMHKYDIAIEDIIETSRKRMNTLCYIRWAKEVNEKSFSHAHIIRELMKLKEGKLQLVFTNENFEFSYDAYDFIINSLCIN